MINELPTSCIKKSQIATKNSLFVAIVLVFQIICIILQQVFVCSNPIAIKININN